MPAEIDAFKEVHWNLAQVAAWVCNRTPELVNQFAEREDGRPTAALIAIHAALHHDEIVFDWDEVLHQIVAALQDGKLQATGYRAGASVRTEIEPLEWTDLRLKFDPDEAMVTNAQGLWEARWTKLKFRREGVLKLWPRIEVRTASPPPLDISTNELHAWLKHDTWTAGEAMLLLHGKVPQFPWLENDDLTTHFLQVKVYLNRSLQSGAIGRPCLVDGRQQWVDTPARWYDWAIRKFSVPTMVRSAFLIEQYARSARLHYLQAKQVLMDKHQCSPEEIANWIFFDELIAWFDRDPSADRFAFDWLPGQDFDYVARLTDLYFAADQIANFVPVDRWLTYKMLFDRWRSRMTDDEAGNLIAVRASDGRLIACHPLTGGPLKDGNPKLDDCMFRLLDVEATELDVGLSFTGDTHELIGSDEESGAARQTAHGLVSSERRCQEWLNGLMTAGPKQKSKDAYRNEALDQFQGLSRRSFERAWDRAIADAGATAWSSPGRISKR